MEPKAALRKRMLERRNAVSPEERKRRSVAAAQHALGLDEVREAAFLCTYLAAGSEADTTPLIGQCFREKKRIAVPAVRQNAIVLAELKRHDRFTRGAYGIREPARLRPVEKEDMDAFIVPGIAFDLSGNRVGYGKGYYDVLLADVRKKKIGLAFDFQIVPSLRSRKKDVPMDVVVTDAAVIVPRFSVGQRL